MDCAVGGMILPSVKSWKAKFFIVGVLVGRRVRARTDVAFWKGVLWVFGMKPYLVRVIFAACAEVWVFAPRSTCISDCMLLCVGREFCLRWRWWDRCLQRDDSFGDFGFDGGWDVVLWRGLLWSGVVGECGFWWGLPIVWLISLQWRLLRRPLGLLLEGLWWFWYWVVLFCW